MSRNNILHMIVTNNPDEVPANRLRGMSTGIALRCLSEAILNPGVRVAIKDHADHRRAHQNTQAMIIKMVKVLQLVNIEVGHDTPSGAHWVCFHLNPVK